MPLHVHHGENPNNNEPARQIPHPLRGEANNSQAGDFARARHRFFQPNAFDLPDSISAMRRSVSAFRDSATDGSLPPCRAARIRSNSSAATSPGTWQVSWTICSIETGVTQFWLTGGKNRRICGSDPHGT
jgi:hypothetical protein